jgi:hypothetical protein
MQRMGRLAQPAPVIPTVRTVGLRRSPNKRMAAARIKALSM